MTLRIGRTTYEAERIDPHGEGTVAYRLTKPDGTAYDLVRTHEGLGVCDCPWFLFALDGTAKPCKHIVACVMAGLMKAPRPIVNEQLTGGSRR